MFAIARLAEAHHKKLIKNASKYNIPPHKIGVTPALVMDKPEHEYPFPPSFITDFFFRTSSDDVDKVLITAEDFTKEYPATKDIACFLHQQPTFVSNGKARIKIDRRSGCIVYKFSEGYKHGSWAF